MARIVKDEEIARLDPLDQPFEPLQDVGLGRPLVGTQSGFRFSLLKSALVSNAPTQ